MGIPGCQEAFLCLMVLLSLRALETLEPVSKQGKKPFQRHKLNCSHSIGNNLFGPQPVQDRGWEVWSWLLCGSGIGTWSRQLAILHTHREVVLQHQSVVAAANTIWFNWSDHPFPQPQDKFHHQLSLGIFFSQVFTQNTQMQRSRNPGGSL